MKGIIPEAAVIRLEQNYRSTGCILEAANHLIRNNANRKDKRLWTAAGQGFPLVHYFAENEYAEADFVVSRILHLKEVENRCNRDFAVLYRTHAQSRVVEEEFDPGRLPYTIIGGQKFYERKEIKDVLAYLRLILNPPGHGEPVPHYKCSQARHRSGYLSEKSWPLPCNRGLNPMRRWKEQRKYQVFQPG